MGESVAQYHVFCTDPVVSLDGGLVVAGRRSAATTTVRKLTPALWFEPIDGQQSFWISACLTPQLILPRRCGRHCLYRREHVSIRTRLLEARLSMRVLYPGIGPPVVLLLTIPLRQHQVYILRETPPLFPQKLVGMASPPQAIVP